jgi:hypothetical protein
MGELARRNRHAASNSSECAHHAIWIPVTVVWRGSDATKCVDCSKAVAIGVAAETRGVLMVAEVQQEVQHISDYSRTFRSAHYSS